MAHPAYKYDLGLTEAVSDPLRAATLAMLTDYRDRLQVALVGCPEINSHMVRRYLAMVNDALDQPHHWQAWRGTFGRNGRGPGIDDAIRTAEWMKRRVA